MSASLKERLLAAIAATPPEKRGYVLREASVRGVAVSFTDLLTDLAPFIEAEIAAAKAESQAEIAQPAQGALPTLPICPLRDCTVAHCHAPTGETHGVEPFEAAARYVADTPRRIATSEQERILIDIIANGIRQRAAAGEFAEAQRPAEFPEHSAAPTIDMGAYEQREDPTTGELLYRTRPAPLMAEQARPLDLAFEVEGLLESVESVDTHGWTLPDGQNAIVKSATGHLSVLHTKMLRSWIVKLREIRAAALASRGDDGAPVVERTPETHTCPRCHLVTCSPACIAEEQAEIDADTTPGPEKHA